MNPDAILNACETAEDAQGYAKDWQNWQAEQALSYSELAEWQQVFTDLANKFDLVEEFTTNGII